MLVTSKSETQCVHATTLKSTKTPFLFYLRMKALEKAYNSIKCCNTSDGHNSSYTHHVHACKTKVSAVTLTLTCYAPKTYNAG